MANGLLILGAIILIGVVGNLLFSRTRIPESLFLILAGLLIGPIMGWVPQELFVANSSFFVTIALIIVLVDSGLKLDFYRTLKNTGHSLLYALIAGLLTALGVMLLAQHVLGWPAFHGLFLGVIISGTTTVTVTNLLAKLKTDQQGVVSDTKNILFIESVLTDIIVIAAASVLLQLHSTGSFSGQALTIMLFNAFVVSALLGVLLGAGWVFLYAWRLHGTKLSYIFTIGLAFLVYFVADYLGMNGAMTVAAFSLVIGNDTVLIDLFRLRTRLLKGVDQDILAMKKTDTEFAFLITTFFFVLLGIIFDLGTLSHPLILGVATAILAVKLIARYASCLVLRPVHPSFKKARFTHTTMMSCGVASALVAFLAIDANLQIPYLAEIVVLTIVLTTIVAILGTAIQERRTEAVLAKKS